MTRFASTAALVVAFFLTACDSGFDAALGGPPRSSPISQSTDVRVMSYNIRLNTPDDGESAWPNRRNELANQVRFNRPDIGGMQEVQVDQLRDLEQRLPEYTFIGVGRDDGAEGGEFSPIFFDTRRFTLLDSGTFWLSETPDQPGSVGWDALLPRIVTWVQLVDSLSGRTLIYFNTHFDHEGQAAREQSAILIRHRIADIAGQEALFVVTGDFNVTPDNAAYESMTRADGPIPVADALLKTLTPHHGPVETHFGFTVNCERAWPPIFDVIGPSQTTPRRIDYIFVAQSIGVLRHATLTDSRDGRYLSDHQAVLADLVLP